MRLSRVLAVLLTGCWLLAAGVADARPVQFRVGFSPDARLGRSTAINVDVHVDHSLPAVTGVRILTAAGLTLSESRLGAAGCRRPAIEIIEIMNPIEHRRCPANSLIGKGTATAGLVLSEQETVFGAAVIELHAGPSIDDKPGLLVTADTYNPARMQLTYTGYLYVPPPAFGLGLAIKIPPIPRPPLGAQIALSSFHLAVGARSITYNKRVRGHRVDYHPGGIPLPVACPTHGFRFRVIVRFADGSRRQADSTVSCPPARARN